MLRIRPCHSLTNQGERMRMKPASATVPTPCSSSAALSFRSNASVPRPLLSSDLQGGGHSCRRARRDNHGHTNPAVEGSRQFLRSNAPALLQKGKDCEERPAVSLNHGMAIVGQNPWNILEKSAARDVC